MKPTPKQIYTNLYNEFGPQNWWPMDHLHHQHHKSDPRFEIMIGAILTQNTAWKNVEKAIQKLKKHHLLSVSSIKNADESLLKQSIRSSGYFNQKAKRLRYLAQYLDHHYNGNLHDFFSQETKNLRKELLGLHGIGPETADSILLYAGEKPVFVVDSYTKRLCKRLPLPVNAESYHQIQSFFEKELTEEYFNDELVQIYNEFHALIVNLGKYFCKPKPVCPNCPLLSFCQFGQQKGKSD